MSASDRELFVKMVLLAWGAQNDKLNLFLSTFTDAQFEREVAPGKNSGIYLAGHLITVNDALLPLLGFGEKVFPHLYEIFLMNPDKSGMQKPAMCELKDCLQQVNEKLALHFENLSASEWFERHTSISPEDFLKEPHRNRLNVMITRTHHMAYHLGQLAMLK